ncbi:hypothetical protein GJ496_008576 [Pomphorhynchus laevis]|nr:hypothetical protein GJ496_008576 [Pomphorhynchus laevis]
MDLNYFAETNCLFNNYIIDCSNPASIANLNQNYLPLSNCELFLTTPTLTNDEYSLAVVDFDQFFVRYIKWFSAFPKANVFYDLANNSDTALLKLLKDLGVGFTCANKRHMQQLIDVGVERSRILFGNACKQRSHLAFAKNHGIDFLCFDSLNELNKIHKLYPDVHYLLLKLSMDQDFQEFDVDRGAPFDQALSLINEANELNLCVIGIHIEVNPSNSIDTFVKCLEQIKYIFNAALKMSPQHPGMSIIHLGKYTSKTGNEQLCNQNTVVNVMSSLQEIFPKHLFPEIRVIIDLDQRLIKQSSSSVCVSKINEYCSPKYDTRIESTNTTNLVKNGSCLNDMDNDRDFSKNSQIKSQSDFDEIIVRSPSSKLMHYDQYFIWTSTGVAFNSRAAELSPSFSPSAYCCSSKLAIFLLLLKQFYKTAKLLKIKG